MTLQRKTLRTWRFGEASAFVPIESNRRNDSNAAFEAINRFGGINVIGSILRGTALSVISTCLLIPYGTRAQCSPEPTTVVQGTAFLETPDGPAAGANVIVHGDFFIVSAVTDREVNFRFSNLEPGTYTEATYFGLYAAQKITVEAGAVVQVTLQLKLPDLKAPPKS